MDKRRGEESKGGKVASGVQRTSGGCEREPRPRASREGKLRSGAEQSGAALHRRDKAEACTFWAE